MKLYCHLRPGTYDILSPRYDQIKNFPNKNKFSSNKKNKVNSFKINNIQRNAINNLLEKEKIFELDADKLFNYFASAIQSREYGKFIFTRSVSSIIELIADFGKKNGLSREEMSHIPITELLKMNVSSYVESKEKYLRKISEKKSLKHQVSSAIRLPQILYDEAGVYIIPFQISHPNFVTNKNITAEVLKLNIRNIEAKLENKIILIENADPGFDWIFSQSFVGLITKYGGANSHMAIRCAEFGIPAAIGCGEQRFESCLKAQRINLDCSSSLITFIN